MSSSCGCGPSFKRDLRVFFIASVTAKHSTGNPVSYRSDRRLLRWTGLEPTGRHPPQPLASRTAALAPTSVGPGLGRSRGCTSHPNLNPRLSRLEWSPTATRVRARRATAPSLPLRQERPPRSSSRRRPFQLKEEASSGNTLPSSVSICQLTVLRLHAALKSCCSAKPPIAETTRRHSITTSLNSSESIPSGT